MPGIDLDLIINHFSIALAIKLVKQKLHKMHPHVTLRVKTELDKILKAGFIWAIDYVEWISNIVPSSKHNKSIKVCINF